MYGVRLWLTLYLVIRLLGGWCYSCCWCCWLCCCCCWCSCWSCLSFSLSLCFLFWICIWFSNPLNYCRSNWASLSGVGNVSLSTKWCLLAWLIFLFDCIGIGLTSSVASVFLSVIFAMDQGRWLQALLAELAFFSFHPRACGYFVENAPRHWLPS